MDDLAHPPVVVLRGVLRQDEDLGRRACSKDWDVVLRVLRLAACSLESRPDGPYRYSCRRGYCPDAGLRVDPRFR